MTNSEVINNHLTTPDDATRETLNVYNVFLMYETLIDEHNIGYDTSLTAFEEVIRGTYAWKDFSSKIMRKIVNFSSVYQDLYKNPNSLIPLGVEPLCNLHERLMDGLVEAPGCLRVTGARPKGLGACYMDPLHINNSLVQLCVWLTDSLQVAVGKLERINVHVRFFQRLLAIHPFINGNGRLARLLLCCSLQQELGIPVGLFRTRGDIYLKCLAEHRISNFNMAADPLLRFVLENCLKSMELARFLLFL